MYMHPRAVLNLATAAMMFLGSSIAAAQSMCSARKAAGEGEAPELQMAEADFNTEKAIAAIAWLEKDVWTVIKESKTTEDLLSNTEGFGIPFPNTVTIAKGALLRQRALLERERLEVARLKRKAGSGTDAHVSTAERRSEAARRAFCAFLEKADWVD
jgi:hypothetical protein